MSISTVFDPPKKRISTFSKLKDFYDKRENPSDDDLKNYGVTFTNPKLSEIYHTNIPVEAYIQYPDGEVDKTKINIQLITKEGNMFGFGSKDTIYLGELDELPSKFKNKFIKVKKYNENDILIFPVDNTPIDSRLPHGGKTKRVKRKCIKKTNTRKYYKKYSKQ